MNSNYEKKKEFIVNTVYLILIILFIYFGFKYVLKLISPFLFAFIIAYFIHGPAKKIGERLKINVTFVSIAFVLLFYSILFLFLSVVGINLISMINDEVSSLPKNYKFYIEPLLKSLFDYIEKIIIGLDPSIIEAINKGFDQVVSALGENVTKLSISLVSSVSSLASSLPALLIKTLLMIISTFFIAADYEKITSFMSRQFSSGANRYIDVIRNYVVNTLFVVIKSYVIIMTITFIELSIGLTIIGVKNSVLIALVIAIFDILPVLGTGGIMIPWAIIEFLQGNPSLGIKLVIVYVIVTIIRNVIEPRIVGGQLGLHPIATLISMFVGTSLFGIMGLFGFPIALALLKHLNDTEGIKIFK